jgi:hypothetical protein
MRARQVAFWCAGSLLTVLLIEALAVLAYLISEGELFSFPSLAANRAAAAHSVPEGDPATASGHELVPQPYWGFVNPPGPETGNDAAQAPVSAESLVDLVGRVPKRGPDRILVGLFGGSVAFWTVASLGEHLARELAERGLLGDRRIVVYVAAQGALKQPQQATKLAYFQALGVEFDVIVNLDGLNEVFHPLENHDHGTFPFYPAYWSDLTAGLSSSSDQLLIGEIGHLRRERALRAERAGQVPLRLSVFASTVWLYRDRLLAARIAALRDELSEATANRTHSYLSNGPGYPLDGQRGLSEESADAWMRGSLALRALAEENGARYYHFLQPNQYVPDSKPLGPKERRIAFDDAGPYRRSVLAGYPALIARGAKLRAKHVRFHDLTQIFAEASEPLYQDTCCHLNPAGTDLLSRRIAREVAEDWSASIVSESP